MALTPLAADVWEQALINGRTVHPTSDKLAGEWALEWYLEQGGTFDGELQQPEPKAEPEAVSEPELAQEQDQEPSKPAVALEAPEQPKRTRSRSRSEAAKAVAPEA
jgi:hypothetical protein